MRETMANTGWDLTQPEKVAAIAAAFKLALSPVQVSAIRRYAIVSCGTVGNRENWSKRPIKDGSRLALPDHPSMVLEVYTA